MKICMRWLVAGSLIAAAGMTAGVDAQPAKKDVVAIQNPEISRRGEGARRAELNKLELKPFAADTWGKLTDWQNGAALTAADTKGKVVLVVTYASWLKPSLKGVEAARKLSETHKGELVTVLVHDKSGWADAEKFKPADGATLRLAHDSKNEFRKALLSAQDPEFYVIDRAGQLRFAAIASDSVDKAVDLLVKEKAEDAAKVNDKIAEQLAKEEAERRRTTGAASHIDMRKIPELPFETPAPTAYEGAKWPKPNLTEDQERKFKETGELPSPDGINVPTEGWLPSAPKTNGRVMVYIFLHPDIMDASKANNLMDSLSDRQMRTRDIVYSIAVFNPKEVTWRNIPKDFKFEIDQEKLTSKLRTYLQIRKIDIPFVFDLDNVMFETARPKDGADFIVPLIAVVSSDGLVRWKGDIVEFIGRGTWNLVDRIVDVDPGVKARREAERRWLEANKEAPAAKDTPAADKK